MINEKVKFKLQGHEKFALRDGWLNKGLIMVEKYPDVFQRKDAPDVLGVGSNMVKSIRYWLKAFRLLEEKNGEGAKLTDLANIIKEYDLYLEDNFTLWVLHSNIVRNVEEATSWFMFFNRCDDEELEREQISQILTREIKKFVEGQKFSENSVKNDVDVILNMYSNDKELTDPEDKNISPFTVLNIVKNNDGRYYKNHPDRRIVNEWNVLFELAIMMKDCDSISIEKAIYGECGLNPIYQISEVFANEMLDRLDAMGYIHVDRTAGLDVIYRNEKKTPEQVIKEYYENHR